MNLNRCVVTFGESLLRLSPPSHLRWRQTSTLEMVFGGAEANVAISLANFGLPVQYVTRLPDNEIGDACRQSLRQNGVGIEFIEMGGDRLGIYFLEVGIGNRPSRVIYDRAHSSFATMDEHALDWHRIFTPAGWFHWSGISPAVSANAAKITAQAIDIAHKSGLIISCDLNYRHSLWQWGHSPAAIMPNLIQQCQVLSANTAYLMLGLPDLPKGHTVAEAVQACALLADMYPNLKQIAMTCREVASPNSQRFTAVLWHAGQTFVSPAFSLTNIADRIGAGDAFMAGLIYGLTSFPDDPQHTLNFAAAAAVLKHTIIGDANLVSTHEIEQLLATHHPFDVIR
jgi:2-dehydro-3-deoxygluconokinase